MALVSKILEATLTAGSTSVTFTDSDIPNSLIRVYSSDSNIIPESRILSGNSLTVIYAPQTNNIGVALEIVKQGLDIVDNVLSEDTDKALSAKQGYLLNAAIGDVSDGLSTLAETVDNLNIPENITDLNDVILTSPTEGQILSIDSAGNIINTNNSGADNSYSTTEKVTGKWIDNHDVVTVVYDLGSDTSVLSTSWYATNITPTNVQNILNIRGTNSGGTFYPLMGYIMSDNKLALLACRDGNPASVRWLIVEYVKTS